MQGIIHLENLKKDYYLGRQVIEVLKGISLDIFKNEYVALMGPSGSGKSTLMNIVGCLDTPTSGKYILNGKDVSRTSDNELAGVRNKEIGFVFQQFNLLPRLTAVENVALPLVYAGVPKKQRMQKAMQVLEKVDLADRAHHKPNEMSGGQNQRVAIARALVNDPSIILADEPTGNLDSANAQELHQLFFDLRKDLGQTFLIVTHNEELSQLSDRTLHMKDGKIV